jgi:hypothetical protein
MLAAMAVLAALPKDLRIPVKPHPPVLAAAFGPSGLLVATGRARDTAAVVHFDADLGSERARVLGTGEVDTFELIRTVCLADGRFLLCTRGGRDFQGYPGEANVYVDPNTLDATSAAALVGAVPDINGSVSVRDIKPRDAFVVGDELVLGHGDKYSGTAQYMHFSAVSLDGGEPKPWIHDLNERLGHASFGWSASHAVVTSDSVVLAGKVQLKMSSTRESLVRIGPDRRVWRFSPEQIVKEKGLMLVLDRGRPVIATQETLQVRTPELDVVAQAQHPFLKEHRLLASDGSGRLLWYGRRKHLLLLSEPDDVRHDDLDASLVRLAAAADEWTDRR